MSVIVMFQAEFTPTRETSTQYDEENFLTEHPQKVISAGKFHDVPYVVGAVAYESAFFTSELDKNNDSCVSVI